MNNSLSKLLVLITLAVVLLVAACSSSLPVSASQIYNVSKKLNCPCGSCTLVLVDCNCEEATKLTALIKKKLAAGQTEPQIIQSLVSLYGQRVLVTEPPAQ